MRMSECPTDDTLCALVHQALDVETTTRVTSHLDDCVACRQVVIAAVRARIVEIPERFAHGTPTDHPAVDLPFVPGAGIRSLIGTRLGRYEVRRLIGAGGMGQVYEAYDAELDRAIALKVMRPDLSGIASVLAERLVRESRIMAKLVHSSVITVFDVGRVDDLVFIAMELIDGETLGAYLQRVTPSWREIVGMFVRAGRGLSAAHLRGIVHRDFKPDNVLVELDASRRRAHRVLVTDFGIARGDTDADETPEPWRATGALRLTATGARIGTLAYMAPEQLAGEPVDQRADVFAFAVAMWEALFGERPFPGRSIDEIRAAMQRSPERPQRTKVPARIIRALERSLAVAPGSRMPDMASLIRELEAARPRIQVIGPAVIAVVAVGLVLNTVRVMADRSDADPCASGRAAIEGVYAPRRQLLAASLGATPKLRDEIATQLDKLTADLRATHLASCHADRSPVQAGTTAACLEARRLELDGFIDDLISDGPIAGRFAARMIHGIGDPRACADPAPGLLAARVPAERALRRQVTAVRYRAFDAEAARDRSEYAAAGAAAIAVVRDAAALWPPLHAEALYLLGTTQSMGGDNKAGLVTLKQAAAVAERAHHDYIAASAWIQLAQSTAFDEGDPARALEYTTYAEAAVDRIGRPPDVTTMFEYVRGSTLVELDRQAEAELALRHAVELAETRSPQYLSLAIQGLGYLYESQGRYVDAIDAYRRALARLAKDGGPPSTIDVTYRGRLAVNLSLLGKSAEAEVEARGAMELADRLLGADNLDRWVAHINLAQVLQDAGKLQEALAVLVVAKTAIVKIQGDRDERYAETVTLEGMILVALERYREAEDGYARACDIIAFTTGADSSQTAECWMAETFALAGLGKATAGIALIDRALPILKKAYGDVHPQIANAYVSRGSMSADLGRHAEAIQDLERAVTMFGKISIDPAHRAAAEWALGKELWSRDPRRARELVEEAVATLATRGDNWKGARRDATAWLAAHKPR